MKRYRGSGVRSATDRAFIAIEIPDDVVRAIIKSRRNLEKALPRARRVRAKNQHLTLRFLGEVSSAKLKALTALLISALERVDPVTVSLRGAGFFPNAGRPRVAWVGGAAVGIERVLEGVNSAVSDLNIAGPDKPWSLHLTQARLVKPWRSDEVQTYLEWGQSLELPTFQAQEVVVFTSDLKPDGAVYTAVERIQLA